MRMMEWLRRAAGLGWVPMVAAGLGFGAFVDRAGRQAVVEEKVVDQGIVFRVVRLAPERVRLVWKGESGAPMRSFGAVQDLLRMEANPTSRLESNLFGSMLVVEK